jgi:hypothetical protein
MNNINTNSIVDPDVAQPFTGLSLAFLQNATSNMINGICTALVPDPYDPTVGYCLSGLSNTGTLYFNGYIYFNGELFACNGGNIAGYVHPARLVIDVTNDGTADPCTFSDGTPHSVHKVRVLKIEDVASGGFLLSSLIFLQPRKINTKTITSTGWNMDTVPQITVAHGLTLSKIRGAKTMIMNNAGTLLSPLDVGNYASSSSFPDVDGRTEIGATNIVLDKRIGGQFDAAGYNNATAYITIEYVD